MPHDASRVTHIDTASDEALLSLVRDGDMAAAGEIFNRHYPAAVRAARSCVDASAAEDVASDAFERLFTAIRRGGGPTQAVRPYLVRAVRNCAIDTVRRRHEYPTSDELDLPSVADHSDAIDEALLVRSALATLPERWQAALWLSHVDEVSRTDIGRQLGIKAGAVSQLTLRAREGFRKAYLSQYVQVAPPECREVAENLPKDVRLSAVEKRAVNAHLKDCSPCTTAAGLIRTNNSKRLGAVIAVGVLGGALLPALAPAPAATAAAVSLHRVAGQAGKGVKTPVLIGSAAAVTAMAVITTAAALSGGTTTNSDVSLPDVTSAATTRSTPSAPPAPSNSPAPSSSAPTPSNPTTPAEAPVSQAPTTRIPTAPRTTPVRVTPRPSAAPPSRRPTVQKPVVIPPTQKPTSQKPLPPSARPSQRPTDPVETTPPPTTPPPTDEDTTPPTPEKPDVTPSLELGVPLVRPRASATLGIHSEVRLLVPAGSDVDLTITFERETRWQVHGQGGSYGRWQCEQVSDKQVDCRGSNLPASSLFGFDLADVGPQQLDWQFVLGLPDGSTETRSVSFEARR